MPDINNSLLKPVFLAAFFTPVIFTFDQFLSMSNLAFFCYSTLLSWNASKSIKNFF